MQHEIADQYPEITFTVLAQGHAWAVGRSPAAPGGRRSGWEDADPGCGPKADTGEGAPGFTAAGGSPSPSTLAQTNVAMFIPI